MVEVLTLFLAACGTALATGLGTVLVFYLGDRAGTLTPVLLGFSAGVMGVAAVFGLLLPAAEEGSALEVGIGLGVGIAFLLVVQRRFRPEQGFMGRRGDLARSSALVFLVLLVHSLPEGFAIGTAWASTRDGLSLFVVLAIAIQNVPEGTTVAVPMAAAGFSRSRQFWAAVATSAPQPVGALIAFAAVEEVSALLPISFAFAAGAMLALIAVEILPSAHRAGGWLSPSVGILAGGLLMGALTLLLGV